MKNKYILYPILVIAVFVFWWLVAAFVSLEINMFKWDTLSRAIYIVWSLTIAIPAIVIIETNKL